jgi:hypothetical protein
MSDVAGRLTIVFNGEIYNFADLRLELEAKGAMFRSHSDTEVILAAYREWGAECVSRLNGMFAFALYDAEQQVVLLARDRAGEKPLFYHYADGTLRFASELKGLLADPALPRRIEPESLDCYLALGYVPGGRCILQGFNKLPAAHALRFDMKSGLAKVWRYWQLPDLRTSAVPDEAALLDELESLLQDSVRRQLVADVPVGVLLSGGVDSSLVTAMARRSSSKLKTFTIRFPGHGSLDETEHARLIARHFATEHVELEAQPTTADLLPRLARQFDEPVLDSSMIPTFLVCELVRRHCTVALGGDGGDELFGGYGSYSRLLWMENRLGRVPRPLRSLISTTAERALPVGLKGRNWLQGLGADLAAGAAVGLFVLQPDDAHAADGSRARLAARRGAGDGSRRLAARGSTATSHAHRFLELSRRGHPGQGGPRQHVELARSACAIARLPPDRVRVRKSAVASEGHSTGEEDAAQTLDDACAAAGIRSSTKAGVFDPARKMATSRRIPRNVPRGFARPANDVRPTHGAQTVGRAGSRPKQR